MQQWLKVRRLLHVSCSALPKSVLLHTTARGVVFEFTLSQCGTWPQALPWHVAALQRCVTLWHASAGGTAPPAPMQPLPQLCCTACPAHENPGICNHPRGTTQKPYT
jgi:hypothetical protein